jgi:hypothetical protein
MVDPKKRITIKEALEHPFFQMMVRKISSIAVLFLWLSSAMTQFVLV